MSLFEQINAFYSQCDHQHLSCTSSPSSVPTGSTASRRSTQFSVLKRSIPGGARSSQVIHHPCSLKPGCICPTSVTQRRNYRNIWIDCSVTSDATVTTDANYVKNDINSNISNALSDMLEYSRGIPSRVPSGRRGAMAKHLAEGQWPNTRR
jgi:hypothetical protein